MSNSTRLALPFIDAAQSQKHVTHNEALVALDALVLLSVKSRDVTAPPGVPVEGDRYLVGSGATDAFSARDFSIAAFDDGGWAFMTARAGWRTYVEDEKILLVYDGAHWVDLGLALRALQNLSLLGVGTTADASNPLSAKLNAALFAAKSTGEGGTGDLRFTLNKSAVGNTVSQLYETNWSGRAQTGLTGDDHFHVKVSADGATWKEAINIDPATGQPSFPRSIGEGAPLSSRNRLRNAQFGINQRALSGTVTLAAGQHGHDGVKGGASGATYTFAASGIDTTITVTAGSIILPIASILMEGGVYTLSHAGTAQARVWQGTGSTGSGAYAGAPFQTPNLTANTQTNVEFSTGTVLRPQFEPGAVVTTFERRRRSVELLDCQDYYFNSYAGQPVGSANPSTYISQVLSMTTANNGFAAVGFRFPTTMRAAPTLMIWAMDGASGSVSANGGVTTAAAQPASISRDGFLSVQNLSGAAWTAAAIKFGLEASAEI
ncbi:MAG: DUF2793 domain-containing protein [Rhodoblastus sp.]|nr:DUF2793 domain-containing protein [Rhodoblastus sp.]